jgi:hypothetical protein
MARVVITMEGGLIQHIMADTEDVKVMVIDYDTEGVDAWRLKEYDDSPVYTCEGVDDINPDLIDEIDRTLFKEIQEEPKDRWDMSEDMMYKDGGR